MKDETILTILLPCLNEAETLNTCIQKSIKSLSKLGCTGEVLVADNGSTDGSQAIATKAGARLIQVEEKGYGSALQAGIAAAKGKYVIMGDADDSYALEDLGLFKKKLDEGYELVMGDRFAGGIEKGAMPWLHKYLGNPVLSFLGRLFFKVPINDFHCGLRGFNKKSIEKLHLRSKGMEFASEMVVKASLNKLKISEVPTTLKADGRSRKPHLRTWRDGFRHIVFLLAASPRWLFLYPGISFFILGFSGMSATMFGPISFGPINLDLNTYFISLGLFLVGLQTILMGILARVFSTHHGILPESNSVSFFDKSFTLERGIILGVFLIATALAGVLRFFIGWANSGFDTLNIGSSLRISGILILIFCSGIQILFASFFASILQVY